MIHTILKSTLDSKIKIKKKRGRDKKLFDQMDKTNKNAITGYNSSYSILVPLLSVT